jgi:hypothetical protein
MKHNNVQAKLLRRALGLPETATDEQVKAACKGQPHEETCDAVSCQCVQLLADGAPGLTADLPLDVIITPEVLKARGGGAPLPAAGPNCCGLDGVCRDGAEQIADLIKGKKKPAQCCGEKK